jgi:PilZ domain
MSANSFRPIASTSEARRTERYDLAFQANLREPGATRFTIFVKDLSVTGFRCETSFNLKVGKTVWLTIPGLGPLEAEVKWKDGFQFGCSFAAPLHPAVLDHIARQVPKEKR